MHLVKWDVISKKKENGGLGVKNLRLHNLSLIARWWRRFNKKKDSLWVKASEVSITLIRGVGFLISQLLVRSLTYGKAFVL